MCLTKQFDKINTWYLFRHEKSLDQLMVSQFVGLSFYLREATARSFWCIRILFLLRWSSSLSLRLRVGYKLQLYHLVHHWWEPYEPNNRQCSLVCACTLLELIYVVANNMNTMVPNLSRSFWHNRTKNASIYLAASFIYVWLLFILKKSVLVFYKGLM